jgi:hypothetical protein
MTHPTTVLLMLVYPLPQPPYRGYTQQIHGESRLTAEKFWDSVFSLQYRVDNSGLLADKLHDF